MSEREKGAVLEALNNLSDHDKQFVLGYAAGRAANGSSPEADEKSEAQGNGQLEK